MPNSNTCTECPNEIPPNRMSHGATTCSEKCARRHHSDEYRKVNPTRGIPLPTGTRGAISEYKVIEDLLGKGYEVFRACSPACSCDIAVLFKDKLLRIEVRTGFYTPTGTLSCSKANFRADLFAIVTHDKIIYEPTLESLASSR